MLNQYASKFGKLSSGHQTRKGQFLIQSQRKAMPKNAQVQFSSVTQSCLTLRDPMNLFRSSLNGLAVFPTFFNLSLNMVIRSSWSEPLEKAMAPHSSTLAWQIPWVEEPGGLQSIGLLRVRHDWATSLSLFTFMHWRRKWQPTPVFLPGESQGRGSLVGCCLWGRTESDTTEAT